MIRPTQTCLDFLNQATPGIYKFYLDENLGTEDSLPKPIIEEILRELRELNGSEYFTSPDEFFRRWLNHRVGQDVRLPQSAQKQGFELYLPEVIKINSPDKNWQNTRIEGNLLVTELGYSADYQSELVFKVRYMPSKSILEYTENLANFLENPRKKKHLHLARENSLESENTLKSKDCTYTLIGISPEQVYASLRKIGFEW